MFVFVCVNESQALAGLQRATAGLQRATARSRLVESHRGIYSTTTVRLHGLTISYCVCVFYCTYTVCRNHASLDLPEDAALIGLLAVHSEFQSRGLGKTLFAAATAFAKSEGKCSKAMMFVINKRLDIQAWYERLGFQWTGEKRDFVFPDLTLQEDIWFKIYEKSL